MRFSTSFIALAAPLLVSAAPVKRTASANDLLVLSFAGVLEELETQFYTQALSTFQETDFITAGFSSAQIAIQQFTAIQIDESTHSTILQSTIQSLGGTPISGCQFNFDSVLTDVTTMVATARVVENLGVAAYLGAAHLLDDPVLLTDAASIVTVEARHQTILNVLSGAMAIPQAFDIPFSPSQVLAVASQFISGCDIGVPANPTLTITNTETVTTSTSLTFSSTAINGTTDGFFCQMMLGGAPFSIPLPFDQCIVPANVNGPVALYITSDGQPLANNIRDQASNSIVAGPTMVFIDIITEELGTLARPSGAALSNGSGSSSSSSATASAAASTSSSVTTITPDQASSILASVEPSATLTVSDSAAAAATATGTGSAAAAAATAGSNNAASGSTSVVLAPGGPNMYTGPTGDGSLTVVGWSTVPK